MTSYDGTSQQKAPKRSKQGFDYSAYQGQPNQSRPGMASPSYGSQQQQGGFPSVPQQGQRSAPDMSAYSQPVYGGGAPGSYPGMPGYGGGQPANQPRTVNGAPVAVQDPSGVQRQIDDLKRRGTWDDPQNAKARALLEQKLADINRAPPGYFVTPDGRLEPNYINYLQGPSPSPSQPQYGSPAPNYIVSGPGFPSRQPAPATQYAPPQQYAFAPQFRPQTRDAFIASINDSLAQQQAAGFNTPSAVPPQFNFPALYRQANQMVADGWSNPLAALLG